MRNLNEQMKMDLELKGFSPHTQDAYLGNMQRFIDHFGKSPTELDHEEVKEYLHYLITVRKVSTSYVNIAYSALKFFYETTLQQEWSLKKIPRTKVNKRLPVVLSKNEINAIFSCITNIKHKAMLMTTYAAGLRVSETANLKIRDIDSSNMQIRINQGKGNKDRYSLLSEKNLAVLREYWKEYRPKLWLFPGISPDKPITTHGIQHAFKKALKKTSINKPATVHSLRHSFATHLLDDKVGISYIQKLLGHSSIRTTSVYLHLQRMDLIKIVSPLDSLEGPDND